MFILLILHKQGRPKKKIENNTKKCLNKTKVPAVGFLRSVSTIRGDLVEHWHTSK